MSTQARVLWGLGIIGGCAVALVAAMLLLVHPQLVAHHCAEGLTAAMVYTTVAATAAIPVLLASCYALACSSPPQDLVKNTYTNLLLVLAGAVLGWGIGVLWVPIGDEESAAFSKATTALSAFATGVLAAELGPGLKKLLASPARWAPQLPRAVLALMSLLLVAISVGANRAAALDVGKPHAAELKALQAQEEADMAALKARYVNAKARRRPTVRSLAPA